MGKKYVTGDWARRKANRRAEWILKHGPCAWCGNWDDLQVDHIDPTTKTMPVSHVWDKYGEVYEAELAKCQVLCRRCHRIKTNLELEAKVQHGTIHMYNKYKCRCDACILAWSNYHKAWRAKRKATKE